jgi:hypothetical protein
MIQNSLQTSVTPRKTPTHCYDSKLITNICDATENIYALFWLKTHYKHLWRHGKHLRIVLIQNSLHTSVTPRKTPTHCSDSKLITNICDATENTYALFWFKTHYERLWRHGKHLCPNLELAYQSYHNLGECYYRACWSSANAPAYNSSGSRFEYRPRPQQSWCFSWFSSFSPVQQSSYYLLLTV